MESLSFGSSCSSYAPPCRKPDEARAASVAQQAEVAVHARQAAEASGRGPGVSVVAGQAPFGAPGCWLFGVFFWGMKYENPVFIGIMS